MYIKYIKKIIPLVGEARNYMSDTRKSDTLTWCRCFLEITFVYKTLFALTYIRYVRKYSQPKRTELSICENLFISFLYLQVELSASIHERKASDSNPKSRKHVYWTWNYLNGIVNNIYLSIILWCLKFDVNSHPVCGLKRLEGHHKMIRVSPFWLRNLKSKLVALAINSVNRAAYYV